jgi:archaellum component FlaC
MIAGLVVSIEVLKDIREELKELRVLYKELVEKLIPVEEPTSEEKRAIEEKDEIADEREMMKALSKTNVRR